MSSPAELTQVEAERFVREAMAHAPEGRTTEAMHRAAHELEDVKLDAILWRAWESGRVEARIRENGELAFSAAPEEGDDA